MQTPFRAGPERTIPAPVIAALCMLAMALCYATTANLARIMATELNALMITLLRNSFGLLLLTPLLVRSGTSALRTTRPGLHLVRSACNLGSMLAWFWALPHIVLADGVALMFTGPLFAALGGVLLLGERLGTRRALALAVGFAGVLVIIRPDFSTASLALLAILLSAAGWGAMGLCNKSLTTTDTTDQIVVLNLLMVLPFSILLALFDWQWPSWTMLAIGAVHGSLGTLAHIFLARALALADTAFVMPFDFTRLPFAAAIAYPLFGQLPDLWTVVGALVIFAAAFSIATRERA
jgi:drug/metabolite transporter (DMT)-like permease